MEPQKLLYPLTADPWTLGHLDVLEAGLRMPFEQVVVAIYRNNEKRPLFELDSRVELVKQSVARFGRRVKVVGYDDQTVDVAHREGTTTILRGLRTVMDFVAEFQLVGVFQSSAKIRYDMELQTVFVPARGPHMDTSSSLVRALAPGVKSKSELLLHVEPHVVEALLKRLRPGTVLPE